MEGLREANACLKVQLSQQLGTGISQLQQNSSLLQQKVCQLSNGEKILLYHHIKKHLFKNLKFLRPGSLPQYSQVIAGCFKAMNMEPACDEDYIVDLESTLRKKLSAMRSYHVKCIKESVKGETRSSDLCNIFHHFLTQL